MISEIERAASLRLRQHDTLLEAAYVGPVNMAAFESLRRQLIDAMRDASAALIRADLAVLGVYGELEVPESAIGSPPAAVVVPPCQMQFWQDYALKISRYGVVRAVFQTHELPLAHSFALRQARLRQSGLL